MNLHSKTFGEGEHVIILHGFLGMLDNWQTFGKRLAEDGYEVHLLDLRNHGRSPHSAHFSYDLMVDDVLTWMAGRGIDVANLLGHSMGGKTAMSLALKEPFAVEKLIVVDIAPRAYIPGHQAIMNALLSVDPTAADTRAVIEEGLMKRLDDQSLVLFLMKNLHRSKEGGYHWKMNLPALVDNYHEVIRAIESDEVYENPTLFVRGEDSGYILDDDILDILNNFPRARLSTIPGAGHWVHADNPDALYEEVADFLEL